MAWHIPVALTVKGAVAIGHWLAAHGTGAMAAKAGTVIAKSVAIQGIAATATSVGTIAIASSIIVGNIIWGKEALKYAENTLEAMGRGDTQTMITELAKLALKLDIRFHMLPDAFENLLTQELDYSSQDAYQIGEYIKTFEKEIKKQMDSKRK